MLRAASDEETEPSSEPAFSASMFDSGAGRFEHFEVVKGEDGKPVELGRGAMGITYRAFDVDLRCPVTCLLYTSPSPRDS